jgi:hypothetical protein
MVEGDRVRLRESVAETFSASSRVHVDWSKRRGAVASISRTGVNVKWDDRRTLDQWPHAALESE